MIVFSMAHYREMLGGADIYIGDNFCVTVPTFLGDQKEWHIDCDTPVSGSSVKIVKNGGGLALCDVIVLRGERFPQVMPTTKA